MESSASASSASSPPSGSPPSGSPPSGSPPSVRNKVLWSLESRGIEASYGDSVPLCGVRDEELYPETMASYETVGLFPDMIRDITTGIRRSLVLQAFERVGEQQTWHTRNCTDLSQVVGVEQVHEPGKHWMLFQQSNQSTGNDGVKFLSSEQWKVTKCGVASTYRVNYFRTDDVFWADVVPMHGFMMLRYFGTKMSRFFDTMIGLG